MIEIKESLNPCDTLIFPIIKCYHSNIDVAQFCEYVVDQLGFNILASVIHDRDFSYFDDINDFSLDDAMAKLTEDSMSFVYEDESAYCNEFVTYLHQYNSDVANTLFNHYSAYHRNFLNQTEPILRYALFNNINYRDFNISSDVDKIVLRLYLGVANV